MAEAEALRTQLEKDLEVIRHDLKAMGMQAKSIVSWASIAATVVAGFSALRGARKKESAGKSSLISTLFTGVRAVATVWLALRSRQRS